jgi:ABC-type transport system involved in multi-copper enzyme maturation permease subunit
VNALRSELIKTRAYRLTGALLPMVVVATVTVAAFVLVAGADAARGGETLAAQIELVALAPSSGTFLSDLLVGIFAVVVVTADLSSGTVNLSLMAVRRGELVAAKVALGVLAALAASVVAVAGVALAALVLLPGSLLRAAGSSTVLWGNVLGMLASHLTWATMGSAAALVLRRSAPALGVLLGLVLVPPVISASLRGIDQSVAAGLADLLPAGLMQAATVTAPDAVTALAPIPASLGLVGWCVVFVAIGGIGFRPLR